MDIYLFSVLSFFIEALVSFIADIKNGKLNWQKISAALFGGLISWAYGLALLDLAGLELVASAPGWLAVLLNFVFNGIAFGRGAQFLNDFLGVVKARR